MSLFRNTSDSYYPRVNTGSLAKKKYILFYSEKVVYKQTNKTPKILHFWHIILMYKNNYYSNNLFLKLVKYDVFIDWIYLYLIGYCCWPCNNLAYSIWNFLSIFERIYFTVLGFPQWNLIFWKLSVDIWRIHRKAIRPAFSTKILQEFVPVFVEQGEDLIEQLLSSKNKSNVYRLIQICALNITLGRYLIHANNSTVGPEM